MKIACGAAIRLVCGGMAILLLSLLAAPSAPAAIESVNSETRPAAETETVQPLSSVDTLTMPEVDMVAVRMEDEVADQLNEPWRFAVPLEVLLSTDDTGTWEPISGERLMWRLHVVSRGAASLNLGFLRLVIPEGGEMFLNTPDFSYRVGPLTAGFNREHGEYWSPVLPGDELVVEIVVPLAGMKDLEVLIGSVNHGYRGFFAEPADGERSQSCNIDVVCPAGDGWRNEIRAVAVIQLQGSRICSGSMINNTANDFTPYFMTANHCGVTAGNDHTFRVYWNYENSWCRTPGSTESGQQGDGSLSQSQIGATELADGDASDFCLVQLDDDPLPEWNIFWAGWDHSGNQATSAVAIHHPNTQEKRISFENDPTASASGGRMVRVNDYDAGSTEGGSSGCPLYNQNHHYIGQLYGGAASCSNDDYDVYGSFAWSWEGASPADRLKDWLDPLSTGQATLGGIGGSGGVGTIVTGPGPAAANPALTRVWNLVTLGAPTAEWTAYGPDQYGVNVACGDINGTGRDWVITGAGPGAVYGPHVRGFTPDGTAIGTISFLAYGTNKWGVNVACGDVDNDGRDEIITGPGPGAVFGPHVRGWNHDGGSAATPMAGINFFAYGTLKFGTNVALGDIDGDDFDEIVTGAGPGSVFGPHVRGWNVDGGTATSMPGVSFLAYGTNQYGVNVACGDIDGDGIDEIITGPGPGTVFGAHVRGWNYDGGTMASMPGVSFVAYEGTNKGVRVGTGDVDGDGADEILTMPGPDSSIGAIVRAFDVTGGDASAITGIDFDAYDASVTGGGNVAGGILE
jgi:hypothetical protein